MDTFKLFRIDDNNGVVSIAQRKDLNCATCAGDTADEVLRELKPFIEDEIKSMPAVKKALITSGSLHFVYEPLVKGYSGTNSVFLTVDVVEEYQGIIAQCHFMFVVQKPFVDERIEQI